MMHCILSDLVFSSVAHCTPLYTTVHQRKEKERRKTEKLKGGRKGDWTEEMRGFNEGIFPSFSLGFVAFLLLQMEFLGAVDKGVFNKVRRVATVGSSVAFKVLY